MLYEIQNLGFAYAASRVVDGVSLSIAAGDFVAIIGPNGAGKSTLLKLMAGLLAPRAGSVLLEGRPVAAYRPAEIARKVAFVPQEIHVAFPFTAAEMMLMGRQSRRQGALFDTETDTRVVLEAMERTRTADLASRTFNELSGGERQRVVLASALVQEPEVLLLDEPTVYLDLKHQLEFYEMLAGLNRHGMTVVAVTHDVNLAARYAKRMVALAGGRIGADGTPDAVLTPRVFEEIFEVGVHIATRPEGGKYVIPSI